MAEITIKAEPRTVIGKQVKALRREGLLPGVLYGSGVDSTPIQMPHHDTTLIMRDVTPTTLVTLDLAGKKHKVLLRERQRDYLRNEYTHLDFLAISMTERLRVDVALEYVGESEAMDSLGGILVTNLSHLTVECLPTDLVDTLQVDISSLKEFGDTLTVADIMVPDTLTIINEMDEMVAVVNAPRQEAEEAGEGEELGELDESEPEVIEKGKKDEEDEA